MSDLYAPLYPCPSASDSPVIYDYARHQEYSSQLRGYVKIKLAGDVAFTLAANSPYPDAVKVGVMKQLANPGTEITLEQTRILLGWAARRAQHTGRL